MQTLLAAILLSLAVSLCAQQQNIPPGTPGQIKDELIRIEQEIGRANLQCDYRYFERIEAEEFILPMPQGMFPTNAKIWREKKIALNPMLNMISMTRTYVFMRSPPSSQAA